MTEEVLVNPDWESLISQVQLPEGAKLDKDVILQCHLIVSLILFLGTPLRELILFFFESSIPAIKQRAGQFLSFQAQWKIPFAPAYLFELWYSRFKKSAKHLDAMITPYASNIVLSESNAIINSPDLKVTAKNTTLELIRSVLDPGKLANDYQRLAPFTWELLSAFTTSPNKWRKEREGKKKQCEETEPDDWECNGDGAEDLESGVAFDGDTGEHWRRQGFARNATFIFLAISIMAFTRNSATNLFPMLMGLFLEIGGTSSRVISTLSHAGVCVSITTIERLKKILSDDALLYAVNLIQSSTLSFIIFDNINLYLRKSQQRFFNRNHMIHATNAATISLPDASSDALNLDEKLRNRGKRAKATGDDIMPTEDDQSKMLGSFEALVIHLILAYTPGRSGWDPMTARTATQHADKVMATDRPLPPKKTDARPLGVFDVNEGSKQGIVKMLEQLQEISGLPVEEWSKKTRIIMGDWLTSNNIRGAKRDRADDVNSMERLEYVEELSALWHFALNATHKLMRLHFGNAMDDPGSLAKHKSLLNRTWDAEKPNYADAKALLQHSLVARILYTIMLKKNMKKWSDLAKWKPTSDDIISFAQYFVENFTSSDSAEQAQLQNDDYLAHSILLIRDTLIFCEFESAVSQADAGRVLRVLKYWSFSFRGASLHNYARECLEILLRWKYELTDTLRQALEQSWFVNRWGLPGRWIAADLYLEQLNFWVKRVFIAKGSGVTIQYIIEKGSACVEAFREISHRFARTFGYADRARRHKEVDVEQDLRLLTEDLYRSKLHVLTPNRRIWAPAKFRKNGTPLPRTSAVIDCFDRGAQILNGGKFSEFIRASTWDPAVGCPVGVEENEDEAGQDILLNGSAFDNTDSNPISRSEYNDIDDGDDISRVVPGLGSLGGGMD